MLMPVVMFPTRIWIAWTRRNFDFGLRRLVVALAHGALTLLAWASQLTLWRVASRTKRRRVGAFQRRIEPFTQVPKIMWKNSNWIVAGLISLFGLLALASVATGQVEAPEVPAGLPAWTTGVGARLAPAARRSFSANDRGARP